MSQTVVVLLVFASGFAAALLAMWVRTRLPKNHLNEETKDTIKLTMGLVATMSALVLGLLVASTKQTYDTERNEVTEMAAKIIYLDRVLNGYGTESAEIRRVLRQTVHSAITHLWPDQASQSPPDASGTWNEKLPAMILKLAPQNDSQRSAKADAEATARELGKMRWLLFEQTGSSISMPMLFVLICWLAILFFSFGLFAPAHSTAIIALLVSSLSVSGAIFLILELDRPFNGLIQISPDPVRNALTQLEN